MASRPGRAARISASSAVRSTSVAVAIAVDSEQDPRLDLAEAVDDRAGAELRGARGPGRAEARHRQEADDRLGDVRQECRDAVAGSDPEGDESGPAAGDLVPKLGGRQVRRSARLGPAGDDDLVGSTAGQSQGVLGVVEGRAGEPPRPGHRRVGQAHVR